MNRIFKSIEKEISQLIFSIIQSYPDTSRGTKLRKNFSKRDSKTKEQWLNDFENELINYYEQLTGVRLMLRTLDERRELFGVL